MMKATKHSLLCRLIHCRSMVWETSVIRKNRGVRVITEGFELRVYNVLMV